MAPPSHSFALCELPGAKSQRIIKPILTAKAFCMMASAVHVQHFQALPVLFNVRTNSSEATNGKTAGRTSTQIPDIVQIISNEAKTLALIYGPDQDFGRMQVLRDPQIISGFIYEEPVIELPAFTHCGEALCCRGHTRPPHTHEGFEFLYLSRGAASWRAAGQLYQQRIGEMFIAYPREPHATGPKANSENQHIWIGLRLESLGPAAVKLARQIRRANVHLLSDCQDAETILRAIVGQVVALRPRRERVIRALVDAFVALVGQRLDIASNPPDVGAHVLPYTLGVQKALAYMRRNLDRRLPLVDLTAAATARSSSHFCSQFHREVGVTPAAYHVGLRLQAAREALRQPSFEVTMVAQQFGFSSSQHFSTLFKRAFGLPPRAWKTISLGRSGDSKPCSKVIPAMVP